MPGFVSGGRDAVREQRRDQRMDSARLDAVSARIRPGHDVLIVNMSAGGALVESRHRLLPGACVELQVRDEKREPCRVKARVLRCAVSAVRADSLRFRGALVFEHRFEWLA